MTSFRSLLFQLWPLVPVISFLCMPVFILILWRKGKTAAQLLVLLIFIESILAALFTVRTFSGGFGPGIAVFFLSFVVFLASLVIYIFLHKYFYRRHPEDEQRKQYYIRGGLLILFLHLSPVWGYFLIRISCSLQTHQLAKPLISEVQTFYTTTGEYPSTLEDIFSEPELISLHPGCSWLSGDLGYANSFNITTCDTGETLLTTETIGGSSILRYNFTSKAWTSISFLDGACSGLY